MTISSFFITLIPAYYAIIPLVVILGFFGFLIYKENNKVITDCCVECKNVCGLEGAKPCPCCDKDDFLGESKTKSSLLKKSELSQPTEESPVVTTDLNIKSEVENNKLVENKIQ